MTRLLHRFKTVKWNCEVIRALLDVRNNRRDKTECEENRIFCHT